MNSQGRSNNADPRRVVDFLQRSLQIAQQTTAALQARNLAQLEESVEAQHALLIEFSDLQFAALDGAENGGMKIAHPQDSSVSDMVRKLRSLNRKNARLAESGLAFSERLFNVISPPLTYETLGPHSSMNGTVADSKLSLKV
ncbi:MAG: hypothetical protein DMG14_14480 [Acidobacteria bacterium]|nr:MAG: hypothetical protein DMG14_14480 [Acidobacteriota bacterium]